MDADQVRKWKASFEAVEEVTLAERRERTPRERYENLKTFTHRLAERGLVRPQADDLEFHLRWQASREKVIARNS